MPVQDFKCLCFNFSGYCLFVCLFCFVLFCFVLFCFALFNFLLFFCFVLVFVLFCFLVCFVLFCFVFFSFFLNAMIRMPNAPLIP